MHAILARIPDELQSRIVDHTAERVGMIIRDSASKRIIAHLQETTATQQLVGRAMEHAGGLVRSIGPNPASFATGIATVVQNEQIKRKLDVLQNMMGGLQALQMATLVTSVAGMGVTVASTALILSRMKELSSGLEDLRDQIERSREKAEDWDLGQTLRSAETQLQRMGEAELSRNPQSVIENSEHELHKCFAELQRGTKTVLVRDRVSPEFLTMLFSAMAISGSAQIRALIWLEEPERAKVRAESLFTGMEDLAFLMPQDKLAEKFDGTIDAARQIDHLATESRLRMASVPSLIVSMKAQELSGRDYLEIAEKETEDVMLTLPWPDEDR